MSDTLNFGNDINGVPIVRSSVLKSHTTNEIGKIHHWYTIKNENWVIIDTIEGKTIQELIENVEVLPGSFQDYITKQN